MSITKKSILLIFLILFIDQAVKIYIKLNFSLGEHITIFSWFQIYFIENNGMAFGMELFDKLFLTLFRLIAVGFLCWYVYRILPKKETRTSYLAAVALIIAGAMGNILDCLFYGLIFDQSYGQIATLLPDSGGYAPLFYGKVVDMFYFPLIDTIWPSWVPFFGGDSFVFFRPVFNVADASISVGIVTIMLFFRKDLSEIKMGKGSTELDTSEK